jgi:hypothetical protein
MIGKLLRWPLIVFAVAIFFDEALSLLAPWRGTGAQQAGLFFVVLIFGFIVAALILIAVFAAILQDIGSGDIRRGWKLLQTTIAQRRTQRKSGSGSV